MKRAEDKVKVINQMMTEFIDKIGRRSITPEEDKVQQQLQQVATTAVRLLEEAGELVPQEYLKRRMKKYTIYHWTTLGKCQKKKKKYAASGKNLQSGPWNQMKEDSTKH